MLLKRNRKWVVVGLISIVLFMIVRNFVYKFSIIVSLDDFDL